VKVRLLAALLSGLVFTFMGGLVVRAAREAARVAPWFYEARALEAEVELAQAELTAAPQPRVSVQINHSYLLCHIAPEASGF